MTKKTSKLQRHMMMAEVSSLGSHDDETKVGAVLVSKKTNSVIATGFNGFVRGAPDNKLPTTRPDKYQYMQHAEQNLVTHCARLGISMSDCIVVCTHSPCKSCMRLLWQAGIDTIIVKELYRDFEEIIDMKDLKIKKEPIEKYWKLTYEQP